MTDEAAIWLASLVCCPTFILCWSASLVLVVTAYWSRVCGWPSFQNRRIDHLYDVTTAWALALIGTCSMLAMFLTIFFVGFASR